MTTHGDFQPGQRDGTFSDALADDSHPLHPKVEFPQRLEFNEEGLRLALQSALAGLPDPKRPQVRPVFSRAGLVEALESVQGQASLALAYLAADSSEPEERKHAKELLRGLERIFRWMLEDGRADAYTFTCRGAVVAWMLCPQAFGAVRQIDLLDWLGLEHKQSLGRYVSEFRAAFDYFNPLMRSEAAIRAFRQREANKRAKRKGGK